MSKALSFEEWVAQVPESIKQDPLWNFQVYPKALYLYDLGGIIGARGCFPPTC